jgi:hypothetical protein
MGNLMPTFEWQEMLLKTEFISWYFTAFQGDPCDFLALLGIMIQMERLYWDRVFSTFCKGGTCCIEDQNIADRYKFFFCQDSSEWM